MGSWQPLGLDPERCCVVCEPHSSPLLAASAGVHLWLLGPGLPPLSLHLLGSLLMGLRETPSLVASSQIVVRPEPSLRTKAVLLGKGSPNLFRGLLGAPPSQCPHLSPLCQPLGSLRHRPSSLNKILLGHSLQSLPVSLQPYEQSLHCLPAQQLEPTARSSPPAAKVTATFSRGLASTSPSPSCRVLMLPGPLGSPYLSTSTWTTSSSSH